MTSVPQGPVTPSSWAPRKLVVQGTGYVGLPAAILLADAGYEVVGVDIDENVVQAINDGVLHIDEAELSEIMARPTVRSNLTGAREVVEADAFIVAVPTPLDARSKSADLSMLIEAIRALSTVIAPGNLVIVESTIPPGACRRIITPLLEESGLEVGIDIELAHCPERILPGDVFAEITNNDRIIGSATKRGRDWAKTIYRSFVRGKLLETDDVTAELTKLAENAARDVAIAFANELSEVALGLGADPNEVIALANHHPRVDILTPGIGVGGHCIPIDPWFIAEADPLNSTLIFAARQINDARPARMATTIRQRLSGVPDARIVLAGATYKPDTVDVRESPAIEIYELLRSEGYEVLLWDPLVPEYATAPDLQAAAKGADAVFVLVAHSTIRAQLAEPQKILTNMRGSILATLP